MTISAVVVSHGHAAEPELSLARARKAFQDIECHPAFLPDVSTVTTRVW